MKKAILHLDLLVSGLERTKKVKITSPVVPIAVNWLLEFQKGTVKVTATDLDVYLSVDLACECPEPFSCLVHPNALNLLKKMDSQPIVLEYNEKNHEVAFVADGDRGIFQGDSPSAFPKGHGNGKTIGLFATDSRAFEELGILSGFMSTDDLRPAMKGVNFRFDSAISGGMELCATNGRILATSSFDHQNKGKTTGGFILRDKAVKILASFAPKKKESPVTVDFGSIDDNKWINVSFGDMTLTSKAVQERYPDYRQVIPKESLVQFSGDKATFLKQMDKALTCANISTKQIKLSFKEKSTISATDLSMSVGYESELKGLHSGTKPFEIGFNGQWLKDVVSCVQGETFVLQMTQANKPGVVREGQRLMLIMPLMLNQYA